MTEFVKRGLPYTSNSMNLENCNLGFKVYTNLKFSTLTYVGTRCCLNFKGLAVFNLKLLIVKVGKMDVCGRPLFANPVTIMFNPCITTHVYNYTESRKLTIPYIIHKLADEVLFTYFLSCLF